MRKKPIQQCVIVAIAAALGLGLGSAVRLAMRGEVAATGGGMKGRADKVSDIQVPITALMPKLSEEQREVRAALEVAPRLKQLLWFATRAEAADPDEMAQLFKLAGNEKAIRRMLAAHWAQLDPRGMFDTLAAGWRAGVRYDYGVMEVLMSAWMKSDPGGLELALDEGSFPGIEGTRMTAAGGLMLSDPERGLDVLEKWDIRSYIPSMEKVTEWAKTDPAAAAKKVASIDADYAGREALGAVAKAWGGIDPAAALEFAAGLRGEKQSVFAHKAMEAWAKKDLEGAIAYADSVDDVRLRGLLGTGLLATWGRSDPAAALEWSEQNLHSQLRTQAVGGLVESLARKDPAAAAAVVAGLEGGGGRSAAVQELLSVWVRDSRGDGANDAIAWLGSLEDKAFAARALASSEWAFNQKNPESIIGVVEGPHAHLASERVIRIAAEAQVRRSPQAAIDWAANLPPDRSAAAGVAVIKEWVQLQPEIANAWAMELDAGDQRTHAIDALARSYTNRPLDGLDDWLGELGTAERLRAIDILKANYGSKAKKAELAEILGKAGRVE